MTKTILAFDLGTSGTKASLFDLQGRVIASATASYETAYPHPTWAEQNADDWWRAVCTTSRELLGQPGVRAENIAVIALCGHMMGVLPVDERGQPLRPSIIWADQRATHETELMRAVCGDSAIYQQTGHRLSPAYCAAKMLWIKHHEPDIYARTRYFLQVKDYIAYRLSGVFATDYSDASGTHLFDLAERCWSQDLIAALSLDADQLPPVFPSAQVIGQVTSEAARVTGLRAGIPIVIGGGDGSCATVGAGAVVSGDAYVYIGSSAWVCAATDQPLLDPGQRIVTFAHLDTKLYCPLGAMQSAGAAYAWLSKTLQGDSTELDAAVVNSSIGANALLFLPFMMGERAPLWNPMARGVFLGLTPSHTRGDLTRAVLEGVALNLCSILKVLTSQGVAVEQIRFIGGGAQSSVWRQILADVFGIPILIPELLSEATAWGAAVAGGVGMGLFKNFDAARQHTNIAATIEPDLRAVRRYAELHKLFGQTYQALIPIYEGLAKFGMIDSPST